MMSFTEKHWNLRVFVLNEFSQIAKPKLTTYWYKGVNNLEMSSVYVR